MARDPPAGRPARAAPRTGRVRRRRRWWPAAAAWRRWLRRWRRTPAALRVLLCAALAGAVALTVNAAYQVARKPTELFFPVSGALYKTPLQSWQEYGPLFRRYATRTVTADLLAALAQVEGSGNPLVRTYWRWSWVPRPFELYRPASSAVGMYQITDGTFAEARHYCIHDHALAREGPWNDWHGCWFNALYVRVLPADAIELTAAYLELKVDDILAQPRHAGASTTQRQHLAAVVHLCGAGAAALYARRGFRFAEGERCGDHDPREYLRRVERMRAVFAQLAAADEAADAQ
jgi:hypothetical protein